MTSVDNQKLKEALAARRKKMPRREPTGLAKRREERRKKKKELKEQQEQEALEKKRKHNLINEIYKTLRAMKPVYERLYQSMVRRLDELESMTPEQREAYEWPIDFTKRLNHAMEILYHLHNAEDEFVLPTRRARVYEMLMPFLEMVDKTKAWKKNIEDNWIDFFKATVANTKKGETYRSDIEGGDALLETEQGPAVEKISREYRQL